MAKRINSQCIKINQTYTVEEAAEALKITRETVRRWIKGGMLALTALRPTLILGYELRKFLKARATNRRRSLLPDELFCMKCRTPRKPRGMKAEYVASGVTRGMLFGHCDTCGCSCCRFITLAGLQDLSDDLEISRRAPKHD